MDVLNKNQPLPPIRKDLEIFRGPDADDGSPTYNIYDPVLEKYYKISWAEAQIFQLVEPNITLVQLLRKIKKHTLLNVAQEDIVKFYKVAWQCNLLNIPKSSEELIRQSEKNSPGPLKWLMSHYLNIRIPLINPDRFLEKTLPYIKFLVSRLSLILYACLSFIGFTFLIVRFDEYLHTFSYFFSFSGILAYALTIALVKLIHEFSHAYVAKTYGITVPRMGIAFLVFFPVLFTDVTHGWRLESRKERFAISFAGLAAELIVAGLATFFWGVVSPGLLKSVLFVVSSTSLITSILFNLNPALKFDGYYILCDILGIDNLLSRAFTVTRWKLRSWLLGVHAPPPEKNLTASRIRGMVFYSIYAWIYRIVIFTTISYFLYYNFTKVLGILLLIVTASLFFVVPIFSEIKRLKELKSYIHVNPRMKVTALFFTLLFLWILLPLPHNFSFIGITQPAREQSIYVPYSGKVTEIYATRGQNVVKGQPLLQLQSDPLNTQIGIYEINKKIADQEIQILTFDEGEKNHSYIPGKVEELATITEGLAGLLEQKEKMDIKAKIDGVLFSWEASLKKGQYLSRDDILGKIADPKHIVVNGYLPEKYIRDVKIGQPVAFQIGSSLEEFDGVIQSIHPIGEVILNHQQLASIYGGNIPVTKDDKGKLALIDNNYLVHVVLDVSKDNVQFGEIGWLQVRGRWRSYLYEGIKGIVALFWQESGM